MMAEAGAFEAPGKTEAAIQTPETPEASRPKSHKISDCLNG